MQRKKGGDFPGSPVLKNLPANAGDMGPIHDPGIFHIPWVNLWDAVTELLCYNYRSLCTLESALCNRGIHHNEKPTHLH